MAETTIAAASTTRRRKGDKRERTRARLIEAAAAVIREKGYDRTTLDEVASRAGMTRGAIYGNFKNREDVFLGVVETAWKPIVPQLVRGASFREQMRILGEAVVAAVPDRTAKALGAASFQQYALTHEEMRLRLVQQNAEIYARAAKALQEFIPASDLPMSPEQFVRLLHVMIDGLFFMRALTPELIDDELIRAAFEALAGREEKQGTRD